MKCRRGILLAILLYVPLDLSLPTIPGVFTFEAADSVEMHSGRAGRRNTEISVLPAVARDSFDVSKPPIDLRDRLAANNNIAPLGHPMLNRLARATLDPASPSEDPH